MLEWLGLDPSSYSTAIYIFMRLLGAIYLIVYIPLLFQIRGLVGQDGIEPLTLFLANTKKQFGKRSYYYAPTLFWIRSTDTALLVVLWSGIACGFLLMLGVYPWLMLVCLSIIHLSLVTAGQHFLMYAPDTFLLQLTFGATLLLATIPLNIFAWIFLNFLVFRFHFQAGIGKLLSKDKSFRNLKALSYHYLTQPFPTTLAWYIHKFPLWFHKCSLIVMFYLEIIVPFAIFSPPAVRLLVFFQLVSLQIFIWLTGNFSYFSHLTIVACIIFVHNKYLVFLGTFDSTSISSPLIWQIFISLISISFLICEISSFLYPWFLKKWPPTLINFLLPLSVGKPHWIFSSILKRRYEIIIEGSKDGKMWQEYYFYYKPGILNKRPKRIAPYFQRLDEHIWFLGAMPLKQVKWFQQFLLKLLQGSPSVTELLQYNPFPTKPPRYIRATVYIYTFTSLKEKQLTGNWWKRKAVKRYLAPVQLSSSSKISRDEQ